MKQFFKFMFASMFGFFIALFLITVIFFVLTFAILSTIGVEETVYVKNNSVLELKINYDLPERSSKEPIIRLGTFPSIIKNVGLNDLLKSISQAKYDNKIKGIYLDLDNFNVRGMAKLAGIRNSLLDFKESNKFIIAHGNTISEAAYYIASAADSIYLTPTGNMEFDGFGIELTFFKKALDKLEIEPQIFQYGKYKSAVEPFKVDKMSKENREQLKEYITLVYDNVLAGISKSNNISTDDLRNLASNLKINSAEDAKKYGLITSLAYDDEVDSILSNLVYGEKDQKVNKISFKRYIRSINTNNSSDNRIAVIYAIGDVTEGRGDENSIGTENIINSLDRALNNKRVKAIVMRVNSPGGSSLTSDMIWKKIKEVKKVKPIIVSMSDLAASGGYYISCAANKIVAEPNSLTGSIGVFGIIPNTQKFFDDKLGITFDKVSTSKNNGWASITKPLNEVQKKYIQNRVDDVYIDFVSRVADGRKMSFDQVDKIGQGRIWGGTDAKKIGLVDTLGGINLALNIAADKAQITDYKIVEYPLQKEPFDKIMDLLSQEVKNNFTNTIFTEPLNQMEKLSKALKYKGIQTRLPFEITIQ